MLAFEEGDEIAGGKEELAFAFLHRGPKEGLIWSPPRKRGPRGAGKGLERAEADGAEGALWILVTREAHGVSPTTRVVVRNA